jgi:lipopolysaccharide transport system ATP-binding protein
MKRVDIKGRFDEIVDFSGVEKFIDTPVKYYSSGMKVRLAFAVAANLNPEIMIVDEVLAVGDAAFKQKCLSKMGEVSKGGRTILFVSHNMAAISDLCDKTFWLENGKIRAQGPTDRIVVEYMSSMLNEPLLPLHERTDRRGSGAFKFISISFEDSAGVPLQYVRSGQDLVIRIHYKTQDRHSIPDVLISIALLTSTGNKLTVLTNEIAGVPFDPLPSEGEIICRIPAIPLLPGQYFIDIWGGIKRICADHVRRAALLHISKGDFFGSTILPNERHGHLLIRNTWESRPLDTQ